MIVRSMEDYDVFRAEITSHGNRNVHRVNGLLGVIMNVIVNLEYWEPRDAAEADRCKVIIDETVEKIRRECR